MIDYLPGKTAWDVKSPGIQTSPGHLVRELLNTSLILAEDWEKLSDQTQAELANCVDTKEAMASLVKHSLLTDYQASRIEAGTSFGLILGNYRVLDRLGAGGMGVVFKGEHLRMRRLVAIKVMTQSPGLNSRLLQRFLCEMRVVANLQHPNIVGAIDDGETFDSGRNGSPLHYFVMEYVPGQDLEETVSTHGPLPSDKVCCLVYQVASALAEANKHNLVHRDIKPSNIRVTPDGQAKLLDFGLVRQSFNRMTEPGTVLGTLDYLAPEQALDASSVDIRADIFGLGGVLYTCLTGETPFVSDGNAAQILLRRLSQPPPSLRAKAIGAPAELDAVVARMMACDRESRYPTPQAVMNALLPFLKPQSQEQILFSSPVSGTSDHGSASGVRRVLVVDDSPTSRQFCTLVLQEEGISCDEVKDGNEALAALGVRPYDLVLSDWQMPGMTGLELCRRIRNNPPVPNLKIILFSAEVKDDEVAKVLASGADDYLTKQFSPVQLVSRVKAALQLKESQDRTDLLNRHLLLCNQQLEKSLTASNADLIQIRNALVLGLADLVSFRDVETIFHAVRLQNYCRCLAEEAGDFPSFAGQIDANFVQMLECCAPLHDIGKAGMPDHILGKVGNWSAEDRLMMQAHTVLGAETLQRVAQRNGAAMAFLQMAIDIARSHHERHDGTGYPDRLAGNSIPLAARILSIGDAYDGLRSRRTYKPALAHDATMQMMLEQSTGHFDPVLLKAFQRCALQFEKIFSDMPG